MIFTETVALEKKSPFEPAAYGPEKLKTETHGDITLISITSPADIGRARALNTREWVRPPGTLKV